MRSILIALTVGIAAGTVAYAHTGDDATPTRQAGTLTCKTLADVGLVFGKSRVAACTFVSDRGDFAQVYGAILPPRADMEAPETLAWRVVTAGGASRPDMLDGLFTSASGASLNLHGRSAALESTVGLPEARVTLAADDARTEFGALSPAGRR